MRPNDFKRSDFVSGPPSPPPLTPEEKFKKDLIALLNAHGKDSEYSTYDWALAEYLITCLEAHKRLCFEKS